MYFAQPVSYGYSKPKAGPAMLALLANVAVIFMFATGLIVTVEPAKDKPFEVVPMDPIKPTEPEPTPRVAEPSSIPLQRVMPPTDLERVIEPETATAIELPVAPIGEHVVDDGGSGPVIESEPFEAARVLRSAEPPYPLVSRANDEEGTVYLRVSIAPNGRAGEVQVERSSGFPRLDQAAIKAIREWRFAPATRGGQAVVSWVTVPVKFQLRR